MKSQQEVSTGRNEGAYLLEVTGNIRERILERLFLEAIGISVVQTPVGRQYGIAYVRDFWNQAREGFRWNLRMEDVTPWEGIDPGRLVSGTSPQQEVDLSVYKKAFGLPTKNSSVPVDPTKTPAYYLFQHVVSTICFLSKRKIVSLEELGVDRAGELGYLGKQQTFWMQDVRPDVVWELMTEIETGMRYAIFSKGKVGEHRETMKAAHFFSAGEQLASSIFKRE